MKLSGEQETKIAMLVEKSNLTIIPLKDDLIDHLCCVVEHRICKGENFDTALKSALEELAPNGLTRIEEETFFLLNSTKILFMKKLMYMIGLLSAMSISVGWLFKMMRWPGGTELSVYGILAFVFIFIPMLAINNFKYSINKVISDKLRLILGYSSAIMLGMAILFKFLHLPGADMLLVCGGLLFSFGFLPFLFFNMYKKARATT